MLASAGPALTAAALLHTLLDGLLPNLTLIAMGAVTGAIPAAVRSGLGAPAGHLLAVRLAVAGGCYAVSLLRGPVRDVLAAAVRARVGESAQRRLVQAVCRPPGVAHLEDPAVLDRLASARGELVGLQPAGAPMMLLGRIGDRMSGVLACAVLAGFRWWLGLGMLAMWLAVHRPLRRRVLARVATFRRMSEPLRRSWYLLGLSWRPAAAREIRLFGFADWLVETHLRTHAAAVAPAWAQAARADRAVAAMSGLVLASYGTATAVLGWAAYQHRISLGVLVVMLTMLPASMQVGSVNATDAVVELMLASLPDLDALTAELDAPVGPADDRLLPARGLPRHEIRFDGVRFGYPGTDRAVLDGLDLTLRSGQSTAVVGVNGAGKTTLISLLARLREPTGGRILVDGMPLHRLRPGEWQRQVAVVFQDFQRLPLTARENVTLGLLGEPADPDALRRAARSAGIGDLVAGLPAGWDTLLSARYTGGQDLSGGQWQRVALARALYAVERGARVLVLDEPTAHLDVRAEADFYRRFLDITAGTTSLVISHRFSTVRQADQIAVLDGGRITELGRHADLLAAGGGYARMFTAQADRYAGARRGPSAPARR